MRLRTTREEELSESETVFKKTKKKKKECKGLSDERATQGKQTE